MKTETFIAIPGYKKAETNGKFVRSEKTKQILTVKAGTKKYQLFNDAGKRCLITLEEINALLKNGSKPQPVKDAFPVKNKPSAKKAVAEKRPAGEKVKKQTKTEKCYSLHLQGKTTEQIMKATGCPRNAVTRNIWLYNSGKKVY